MHALKRAGEALDQQRPAEAFAALNEAIPSADDPVAEETLVRLRNYAAWLMGDWTDMATLIASFRRARALRVARTADNAPTMRAAVAPAPGRLELADVPVPEPLAGHVKIKVRAFGLNRTEKRLAAGGWPVTELSPVAPLVNGIECAGEVVKNGPPMADESPLPVGARVLVCASSLGRAIDGTHAEYVVVPRWGVSVLPPGGEAIPWRTLAALPLSFGTAAGSLDAMDCEDGDTVLVRGGTSALGLAAITLAKMQCCEVIATSRRASSETQLRAAGADRVLVEPNIHAQVRALHPGGVARALECIGEPTLKETMRCVRQKGVMCQTGAMADVSGFALHLLGEVPSGVKVTCFESDVLTAATMQPLLARLVEAVRDGLEVPLDPTTFTLEQYDDAMAFLDSRERRGKVVVTVE